MRTTKTIKRALDFYFIGTSIVVIFTGIAILFTDIIIPLIAKALLLIFNI